MVDASLLAVLIALEEDRRGAQTQAQAQPMVHHPAPRFHMHSLRLAGDTQAIIDARGPGKLYEATIRYTGDITIRLVVDGQVLEGGYAVFQEYSSMTSSIDAFEDDGDKVVRIANIPFNHELYLALQGTGTARIVARWDETPK